MTKSYVMCAVECTTMRGAGARQCDAVGSKDIPRKTTNVANMHTTASRA